MVDVADNNVVLGVQWLYYVGDHTVNYQIPEMKFQDQKGVVRFERAAHLPKTGTKFQ